MSVVELLLFINLCKKSTMEVSDSGGQASWGVQLEDKALEGKPPLTSPATKANGG